MTNTRDDNNSPVALEEAGRAYVRSRLTRSGGGREAVGGLIHKTLPVILRINGPVTALGLAAAVTRVVLLLAAALTPVIVRKTSIVQPAQPLNTWSDLSLLLERWDGVDTVWASVAMAVVFVPKVLDAIDRGKRPARRQPYLDLAAAIHKAPSINVQGHGRDGRAEEAIKDAIDSVLHALRNEIAELVDEPARDKLTDVTLLEFCSEDGKFMKVSSRTARQDPNGRRVRSGELMAYHVALAGKPFIEHDFLSRRNPYPKHRVTVPGKPNVNYRSILYLPILWAIVEPREPGAPVLGPSLPRDTALGIVCVNCTKAYRFWRWGDHSKPGSAFESIAYERALPYIALLTKLIEPTAHKVPLEVS